MIWIQHSDLLESFPVNAFYPCVNIFTPETGSPQIIKYISPGKLLIVLKWHEKCILCPMLEKNNKTRAKKMTDKKVVVVDDDESIRKTFFLILSKKYSVYLAKDSKEALERYAKAEVDLIIADFKLPFLSGPEMIAKFREAGYQGEVILISAFPDLVKFDDLSTLSISHFFVKPLDLEVFNKSVDFLLCSENGAEKRI